MSAAILSLVLLGVLDIGLWVAAIAMPLGETGRFRAFALASLLLVVLASFFLGWAWTLSMAGIAFWIAAIVLGNGPSRAGTSS
jgi:hypothetical protein